MSHDPSNQKEGDLPEPFAPTRYTGAILVCERCEGRDKGPRKLTTKAVRQELRQSLGDARLRLRVVQTSCLGLCPKKSIAVAAVTPEGGSILAAVRRKRDVAVVAVRLRGGPIPAVEQG